MRCLLLYPRRAVLRLPVIQLPAHLVSRKTKRLLIGAVACTAIALGAYLFVSGFPTISAQSPEGGVFVEGKIELAPDGDGNKNGEVDAGDTVRLVFDVVNRTDKEYPFATLATGLDRTLVYDLWNLSGASSLDDANNTITFPNLWVAPQARLSVSLDVTAKYFTEGEKRLALAPELLDREGRPIGQAVLHEHGERRVGPYVGELPWWVMIPGTSPSPSPTPTATAEPSPSVSPTVKPTPTTELTPTPTPTPESTPTATLEPAPSVTATSEPSPSISPSPL